MNQLIALTLLVLVTGSQCASFPAGLVPQPGGPIVGGADARIADYPWQISLQRGSSHFCGGSIYSQNIIITAAHCLESYNLNTLRIRAGSQDRSSGGVLVQVAAVKVHEDYNSITMENDVAIVRLRTSLSFGTKINKIEVASKAPKHGAAAVVSGWGTMKSGAGSIPQNLRYAEVNIISLTKCGSKPYDYGHEVKPTMICAAADGKDSCQNDSGGPLVSDGKLVGIVSWGRGCASPKYPGVYADAAALRGWIVANAATI